jgi:4-hydroxy-4-methyl-2-oxoglutarate aldolase
MDTIPGRMSLLDPGIAPLNRGLKIAGQASTPMFAELASVAAREKGPAGVVVDGPMRDSDALSKDRFPVWCRGTYAGRLRCISHWPPPPVPCLLIEIDGTWQQVAAGG